MNRPWGMLGIIAAGSLLPALPLLADTPYWPKPLQDYAAGQSACIAIYSKTDDQYLVHNLAQCQERLSPCSTFKIPNTLIALESGVLNGPGDEKKWDGTQHSREALNRDHDLASAIKYSIVWYFQDVALDIGPQQMQASLDAYDYGNRDISGGQDHFWLSSSLLISALEQIDFMAALEENRLPVSKKNQETVKAMMLQDYRLPEGFSGELYGKTGTCITSGGGHGWFTGFLHRDDNEYIFAVNLKSESSRGWDARTLAIEILRDIR
jgi:beta-lactamase class D